MSYGDLRIGQAIASGDTLSWTVASLVSEYPASQGWILTYYLAQAAEQPAAIQAQASGDEFAITWACTLSAGNYHWAAQVSKGTTKRVLLTGTVRIIPDPSQSFDRRTRAEIALAAVEAILPQAMADPLAEYEIPGVKGKKVRYQELLDMRDRLRTEVRLQRGGSLVRTIPANRFRTSGPFTPWGGGQW